ncbi:MAG TPA: FtsX-like permease family protein, partial [Firmicutes bacterium]|nr:FtsX-like permease family protein [Bacillota bacterium]
VFLISNTIRLTVFARRREIGIMKLVGATDWFIRWPFILEGILLGILGTLVSLLVLTRLYNWAVASIYSSLPFVPVVSPEGIIKPLSLLLLGLGFIVGAFGSLVSLRRFLRV